MTMRELATNDKNSNNVDRYLYSNFENAYSEYNILASADLGTYANVLIPRTLRLPYVHYAKLMDMAAAKGQLPLLNNINKLNAMSLRVAEIQRIGREYDYNNASKPIVLSDVNKKILSYVKINGSYSEAPNAIDDFRSKYIGTGKLLEDDNLLINSLGHWYGEYKLPSTLKVRNSRNEELKDGFIVLMFKISTTATEGNKQWTYLNYAGQRRTDGEIGKETQWQIENRSINPSSDMVTIKLPDTSFSKNKTTSVSVRSGYYPVAVYQAGFSVNDKWEVSGTH